MKKEKKNGEHSSKKIDTEKDLRKFLFASSDKSHLLKARRADRFVIL